MAKKKTKKRVVRKVLSQKEIIARVEKMVMTTEPKVLMSLAAHVLVSYMFKAIQESQEY